jgi:predicted amidohydrolase
MHISLYQFNPIWEDKHHNQEKILKFLENSIIDTDVIIFPEMTLTGFTMRSKKFGESTSGEIINFFQSIAKAKKIHIFAGFIEAENGKYFNTLIHLNRNGDIAAKYQKIHPFSYSGENRHYYPGKEPIITLIGEIKIGLSICYDLRFPELFRYYGKEHVEAIINIANWPVQRIEHWRHLLKARAIENLCFMIGVNRVGRDKGNEYNGQSSVFGPMGENLLQINNVEILETIDINLEEVNTTRNNFPFLDDIKLL